MPSRSLRRWPASRFLLAALLVAAAVLRFKGLAWGLRHTPHVDEQDFVQNAALMLEARDLDHRYYEYPGLFFYILSPALALVGAGSRPGPEAYLAARAVVAAFGVANVLLLFLLGSRLAGRWPGLVAAAFLAFSPVDVATSHMVRADVVLETFVLLALLAFQGLGETASADVRSGLALGAAVAVKFTGVLLASSYLARRVLAPGRRLRGTLLAGTAALVAFAALSPYALIHAREFFEGARTQVAYHYQERAQPQPLPFRMLLGYAGVWPKALGWLGTLMAAAGLVMVRRDWRTWAPLVLLPAVTLGVFATQGYRFDRHLVPSFGVLALLAAIAAERMARRWRATAVLVTLVALASPLASSVAYVGAISAPSSRDLAVDWIDAHVPRGARILSTVEGLGLDRGRFEVLDTRRLGPRDRLQALHADVVVTVGPRSEDVLQDIPPSFVARPPRLFSRPVLRVRVMPPGLKPGYVPVRLDAARLDASENQGSLAAVRDGRLDTFWEAEGKRSRDQWLEVDLPEATLVGRVELSLAEAPGSGGALRLAISEDGITWRSLRTIAGRPGVKGQLGPPSQVLLFGPVRARSLRIRRTGRSGRAWSVAELRIDTPVPHAAGRRE